MRAEDPIIYDAEFVDLPGPLPVPKKRSRKPKATRLSPPLRKSRKPKSNVKLTTPEMFGRFDTMLSTVVRKTVARSSNPLLQSLYEDYSDALDGFISDLFGPPKSKRRRRAS